ncbi:MAG TPA: type IV secretory system conjugative DNA transfer family protein, partial [Caulobacterales bacterium]|nr:type IV secretory system conjugative DNA transfer family protein [Caulobacterales bacterium]
MPVERTPAPGALDLLLGWKASDAPRAPFGFGRHDPALYAVESAPGEEPILYGEDRHLLTIAPTGAGKGRGVIIPNLLRFEGS